MPRRMCSREKKIILSRFHAVAQAIGPSLLLAYAVSVSRSMEPHGHGKPQQAADTRCKGLKMGSLWPTRSLTWLRPQETHGGTLRCTPQPSARVGTHRRRSYLTVRVSMLPNLEATHRLKARKLKSKKGQFSLPALAKPANGLFPQTVPPRFDFSALLLHG
jgi:hypothetical protein